MYKILKKFNNEIEMEINFKNILRKIVILFFIFFMIKFSICTAYCEKPYIMSEEEKQELRSTLIIFLNHIMEKQEFKNIFNPLFNIIYLKNQTVVAFVNLLPLDDILEALKDVTPEDIMDKFRKLFIEYLKKEQRGLFYRNLTYIEAGAVCVLGNVAKAYPAQTEYFIIDVMKPTLKMIHNNIITQIGFEFYFDGDLYVKLYCDLFHTVKLTFIFDENNKFLTYNYGLKNIGYDLTFDFKKDSQLLRIL